MIRQGDVLNDTYIIKEQLGAGGGGIIYKAYHQRLKVDVVVKQIKEEVKGHIEGRAEADVLKRLRHTHLPRVYDFLEIDNEIYTVMDYIPGLNLKQALAQNGTPFDQKRVLSWAAELAEALAYLHSMNPPIIHSDIKPSNIMLQPDGHICLIDFNVSLAFDSSMRTSTGISEGFSPPEQYHSKAMYSQMSGTVSMESGASDDSLPNSDKTAPTYRGRQNNVLDDETAPAKLRGGLQNVTLERDTAAIFHSSGTYSEDETAPASSKVHIGTADVAGRNQSTAVIFTGKSGIPNTETVSILERTLGKGIDERSDIYSLGATLYMLLTGIKPTSHYWEIVPIDLVGRAEHLHISVSQGLGTIVKKMMEIDPANRYQNGAALKKAIDNIKELDDVYRRYRAGQRARVALIVTLMGLSAGLLVSGYSVMQRERNNTYNSEVLTAREAIKAESFDEAEAALAFARNLITDRIDAYEAEMQRLYAMGEYEACILYGTENINSPKYVINEESGHNSLGNMFYLLGNAYYETNDYKNAVNSFEQAIRNQPNNSAYYRDLAISLAKEGNIAEAEAALSEAKSLGLGEDSVYMAEGEIAYGKQDYITAVSAFKQVLVLTQSDEIQRRTVFLCADAYRQLDGGYYDEQISFLEFYENAFSGRGAQISEMLAEAYAKNGEAEKAAQKFRELIEKGYASFKVYENMAILQQELSDLDGAGNTLKTMGDLYPNRYETYKRLAFLEADVQSRKSNSQRSYRQMKEYYDEAIALCNVDDPEMQVLEKLMNDIKAGGWL